MNVNVTSFVMLLAGVVLIYSGTQGIDPRTVVTSALSGKSPKTATGKVLDKQKGKGKPDSDSGGFTGGGGTFTVASQYPSV